MMFKIKVSSKDYNCTFLYFLWQTNTNAISKPSYSLFGVLSFSFLNNLSGIEDAVKNIKRLNI